MLASTAVRYESQSVRPSPQTTDTRSNLHHQYFGYGGGNAKYPSENRSLSSYGIGTSVGWRGSVQRSETSNASDGSAREVRSNLPD